MTRRTRYGSPEIFNTDQGGQVTSKAFTTGATRPTQSHQHGRQGSLGRATCSSSGSVAPSSYEDVHLPCVRLARLTLAHGCPAVFSSTTG